MRDKPKSVNGQVHTHDWVVYVKGEGTAKLEHCVEKVNIFFIVLIWKSETFLSYFRLIFLLTQHLMDYCKFNFL